MTLHLSPEEARVVAALAEKSIAQPSYYPMTANGLMAACNQKNCRAPVMQMTEGAVGQALNSLEQLRLVSRDESSPRSVKWRCRMQHELLLKGPAFAVLITLILRGPQTVAELRSNANLVHGPSEADAVLAELQSLADRAQPLVIELPRQTGQSANRWAHCLSGVPDITAEAVAVSSPRASASSAQAEVIAALEARLSALEAEVQALKSQLGA